LKLKRKDDTPMRSFLCLILCSLFIAFPAKEDSSKEFDPLDELLEQWNMVMSGQRKSASGEGFSGQPNVEDISPDTECLDEPIENDSAGATKGFLVELERVSSPEVDEWAVLFQRWDAAFNRKTFSRQREISPSLGKDAGIPKTKESEKSASPENIEANFNAVLQLWDRFLSKTELSEGDGKKSGVHSEEDVSFLPDEIESESFKKDSGEELVGKTDESGTYTLRKSAMKQFELAQKTAKKYGVSLKVNSSYRTRTEQVRLYEQAKKRFGKRARIYAATPGRYAPHMTGGAIDVVLHGVDMSKKRNQQLLRKIMLQAGFAPYDVEFWHYEYGTRRWGRFYNRPPIYEAIEE